MRSLIPMVLLVVSACGGGRIENQSGNGYFRFEETRGGSEMRIHTVSYLVVTATRVEVVTGSVLSGPSGTSRRLMRCQIARPADAAVFQGRETCNDPEDAGPVAYRLEGGEWVRSEAVGNNDSAIWRYARTEDSGSVVNRVMREW